MNINDQPDESPYPLVFPQDEQYNTDRFKRVGGMDLLEHYTGIALGAIINRESATAQLRELDLYKLADFAVLCAAHAIKAIEKHRRTENGD